MKILIYSDIHIHKHKKNEERLKDCLDVQKWIFETAIDRDIKNIVFCGDLFHERQRIDVQTYQLTFELFEKYCKDIKVYMLLGNHDMYHKSSWGISSMIPLQSISMISIVNSPCIIKIANYPVCFLPYIEDPINALRELPRPSGNKILFSHLAIDGAILNSASNTTADVPIEHDGDMIKVDTNILKGWDHVFLGHYHHAQQLSKSIEYIGSPLQLSFGEAFSDKHIIQFDLETCEKEYIKNNFSPRHYIIKEEEVNNHNLENGFVRLYVDDLSATDIVDKRNILTEEGKASSVEILQDINTDKSSQKITEAKQVLFKKEEMIREFAKAFKDDSLDERLLIKIGEEIINDIEITND